MVLSQEYTEELICLLSEGQPTKAVLSHTCMGVFFLSLTV
jgi:hypothetical protein